MKKTICILINIALMAPVSSMSQLPKQDYDKYPPALRLEIDVLGKQYCKGDDEVGMLQLRCRLRFINVSDQKVILHKGSGSISEIIASSSVNGLQTSPPEYEMSLNNVSADGSEITVRDEPDRNFIVLLPNKTFSTRAIIPIPVRVAPTKLRSLSAGSYFLQIKADTWKGNMELANELRRRWLKSGLLWTNDIMSQIITFAVDPKINFQKCR